MDKPFALIVEDDDDAATIFDMALQTGGFVTEIVGDGAAAIARLADVIPDVVVLDLHLPRVSGDVVLHHIRTNERLAEIQVIIASAYPRDAEMIESNLQRANLRGPDLVLVKPVSFSQLRDLSQRLVIPPYPPEQQETP